MSTTRTGAIMEGSDDSDEVRKYSVLVGFLLVLVFVAPCITLALMAKCFQKQSSRRKTSTALASTVGSTKYVGEDRYENTIALDSDSGGFGTFGLIAFPAKKLECSKRIVSVKHQLSCIEVWEAYAPPQLVGGDEDCKRLIAVLKSATVTPTNGSAKENHSTCLKAELSYLSRAPSNHAILNLLGVCSPNSSSTALLLEYPLYGNLLSFLVCKRLGHISNKSSEWAGLEYQKQEDSVLRAIPEENRPYLSSLLDDYCVRQQLFCAPLNAEFTHVDLLILALQIANGAQFLAESGIILKQLSTESVVISAGFFLKLSCLSPDTAFPMHKRGQTSRRSTASGRNMMKWDAPEVMEGNESTEQSNIWRYGMVLWEISSLGDTPFVEIPGKFLVEQIKKGELPHLPEGCSSEFYSIMKRCWKTDSSARPILYDLTRVILLQLQPYETRDRPNFMKPSSPSPHSSPLSYYRPMDSPSNSSEAVLIPESPLSETNVDDYEETEV